ncbi:MAG: hypothetical protein HZB26_21930 [Candidatus Hydrogenedentes bacterium]|nr:hypothetical protein [Candidatus Hydrogenedentota bacterium]
MTLNSFLYATVLLAAVDVSGEPLVVENDSVLYTVGADGQNVSLVNKATQQNLLATPSWPCATLQNGGQVYAASKVTRRDGNWVIEFGASGAEVALRPRAEKSFLTFEVISVKPGDVEKLNFLNLPLQPNASLAGCALALNLKTNVPELPGPMQNLFATAYKRFGFEGAKVALIVSRPETLRETMKEVAKSSDDIPRSLLGGPWALDAEIARGSYLIDIGGQVGEDTVDSWIQLAKNLGIGQIDFHTGETMRFGDLVPNAKHYPHGLDGVKAVVDKLHAAGIQAGLHTYAFFMAKDSQWVSPKPDARLATGRVFTLAQDLSADASTTPLLESPEGLSAITGFQVRNSATIRIDDELITFGGVSAEPPFAFTSCKRGAWGTAAANHSKSAKVAHMKECFGLFAPEGDSTLFTDVAARTAEVYNRCGFDMIYLDALDGADVIAGSENSWHYAAKFVFEINKRLDRPALFEMSSFSHHLWYARSRMGAWDVPSRAFKRAVDIHTIANEECERMFLPAHLGWSGAFDWSPVQPEKTFPDDIEYLCGKCVGYDCGLSLLVGFTAETWAKSSSVRRMGGIIKQYESLRLSRTVPEATRAALRVRGDEFQLGQDADNKPVFRRVQYSKHTIEGKETASWNSANRFSRQTPQLRIQALMAAAPYDAPNVIPLSDFAKADEFTEKRSQSGVVATFAPVAQPMKDGLPSAAFDAKSEHAEPESAWAQAGKTFPDYLNLTDRALGVWVNGDGQGEILNLQLKNPPHINGAISDHYITVDFTGWRYFVLVEPESDRIGRFGWPYSARQNIQGNKPIPFGDVQLDYIVWVDYAHISSLNVFLNNLPANKNIHCVLSPIRALPLAPIEVVNPSIAIAGKVLVFPVTLKSGQYLEFNSMTECIAYDEHGEPLGPVTPTGEVPVLEPGDNRITFACNAPAGNAPAVRTSVTVKSMGEALARE